MAQIVAWKGLVDGATGKLCTHQSDKYTYQGVSGKFYSGIRCNPRDLEKNPYSSAETAQHNAFKTAAAAVKATLADNSLKAAALAAFKANPGKYKTLRGYLMAQEMLAEDDED